MPDKRTGERTRLLAELRDQIQIIRAPLDFAATDTASSIQKVRLLAAVATYLNVLAIGEFGGRGGPARDPAFVEQVVAAAFQSFGGIDPHPEPFDKAAMLLRGITQGHPFNDGNKRTGFLTASYYLEAVGYDFPDPLDDVLAERLCMRVSAGQLRDVERIAEELKHIWGVSES